MSLQSFLKKTPKPTALRVMTEEGEKTIKVNLKAHRPWGEAEKTIDTLKASRVECLDGKGQVLRSIDLEVPDEEPLPKKERLSAASSELVLLAKLLNEASDNGAKRHADAYKLGFDMLAALVRSVVDVQVKSMQLTNFLMRRVAKLSEDVGTGGGTEESGDEMGSMFKQMIVSRMMNPDGPPAQSNGAANGKQELPPDVMEFLRKRAAEAAAGPAAADTETPEGDD